LRQLVSEHERRTGSIIAREILAQWEEARGRFVKVFPHEYRRALTELSQINKSEREAA
jgi:glutamate synthase domain-containing protein 3